MLWLMMMCLLMNEDGGGWEEGRPFILVCLLSGEEGTSLVLRLTLWKRRFSIILVKTERARMVEDSNPRNSTST
jgi:hypothetical protein